EEYEKVLQEGVKVAEQGYLVTFGIRPTKPETGYGYIEYEGNDVLSFREKPNLDTAKEFLKKGNFLWNSGIFCFKASIYLEELFRFEPKVYRAAKEAFEGAENGVLPLEVSLKIPSKSIRSEERRVGKECRSWGGGYKREVRCNR